jgi:hypothetical protein
MGLMEKALNYRSELNRQGHSSVMDRIPGPAETGFMPEPPEQEPEGYADPALPADDETPFADDIMLPADADSAGEDPADEESLPAAADFFPDYDAAADNADDHGQGAGTDDELAGFDFPDLEGLDLTLPGEEPESDSPHIPRCGRMPNLTEQHPPILTLLWMRQTLLKVLTGLPNQQHPAKNLNRTARHIPRCGRMPNLTEPHPLILTLLWMRQTLLKVLTGLSNQQHPAKNLNRTARHIPRCGRMPNLTEQHPPILTLLWMRQTLLKVLTGLPNQQHPAKNLNRTARHIPRCGRMPNQQHLRRPAMSPLNRRLTEHLHLRWLMLLTRPAMRMKCCRRLNLCRRPRPAKCSRNPPAATPCSKIICLISMRLTP